ncbi:hypothetical protein PINS_up005640 [Pythium insidiosum]|nr:hypothetical protein PINS_up005640 [Pythium insidiosum]
MATQEQEQEELTLTPASLAQHAMRSLDQNANGVVTLAEWIAFFLGDSRGIASAAERVAIVENVRETLRSGENSSGDPLVGLTTWFRSIPGAIAVDRARADGERRVRTREWKSAVRSKYPFITLRELDAAAKALDADGSTWITEREFREWLFPTRDVEELCNVIAKRWHLEWLRQPEPRSTLDAFAATLYRGFDLDDNGALARQELRDGLLRRFQITVNDHEMLALMKHFDRDGDGCLSRLEFQQRVTELLGQLTARRSSGVVVLEPAADAEHATPASDQQELATGGYDRDQYEDDHGVDDGDDIYLSSPQSSERTSDIDGDDGADAGPVQRAVEYSQDFDE